MDPVPLADIRAAAQRIAPFALRTPLVRLQVGDAPAEVYLKLENLQPIGSFKVRGAANALALAEAARLADGVYTASAGNMAQGVAWVARRRGVPCRVVVPEHAPATKLVRVGFSEWWQVLLDRGRPGMRGHFVHPVSDPAVIAGNGTIGLEILEDLPDVDAVVVPYGGGGLSSGIACALRELSPRVKVYAAEVETAAPLAASLAAGAPTTIAHRPGFVDGIGGKGLLPEMWPMVRDLLAGSLVVSLEQVAAAIRLLAGRARVVAEGAGAAALAAALGGGAGRGKVVCVVSGGNIDAAVLSRILSGATP
jgi:threonine dehydratase